MNPESKQKMKESLKERHLNPINEELIQKIKEEYKKDNMTYGKLCIIFRISKDTLIKIFNGTYKRPIKRERKPIEYYREYANRYRKENVDYYKRYREENKEYFRQYNAKYRPRRGRVLLTEEQLIKNRKMGEKLYYQKNKEKIKEYNKLYRQKNKTYFKNYNVQYVKNKFKNDPYFRLVNNLRSRINIAIKSQHTIKSSNSFKLLTPYDAMRTVVDIISIMARTWRYSPPPKTCPNPA